jgi:predicted naringenin-chalcone synthase
VTATSARPRATTISAPTGARERMTVDTGARIAALSVADSPTTLTQQQVLERLGLDGDDFAQGIFARCGVQRRHLDLGEGWRDHTLQGRTELVERQLLEQAVRAVDELDVDPRQVDTVISASLYSNGCPTLAHRLLDHYGMDPATDKYHIVGVGCASAVPLLRLAGQCAVAHPQRGVLVVAAESMSAILMPGSEDDPKAKTVGSAIFGDGCAAALVSRDGVAPGPLIVDSQVHQIAGTLHAVNLAIDDDDSHLHLARELPDLASEGLGALVDAFLGRHALARADVDHWIVHPGGRRIVESAQTALALSNEQVAISWQALAEHGNVGTPSIFYVLKSTIEQRDPGPGQLGLAVTIGPGVTVGLMLLRW